MEKKTVKDRKGKRYPADTAQAGGAAYAPHDKDSEQLAEKGSGKSEPPESAGDERTPEKTIGEIKYAEKKSGERK
jgi:hypothetical protein